MIDLRTLFKNHFDTKQIGDDNFRRFAQDHLGRLYAFTSVAGGIGGVYDTMYNDTKQLTDTFADSISTEDYAFASQQASTLQVDEVTQQFKAAISRREGTIRGEFGTNSAEYQKFFPQGLTEYSQASRANIETLLDRVVSAATEYQAILGQNFVNIFVNLRDNYTTARNNQLNLIGNVNHKKLDTANVRNNLEVQLGKNVLQLATLHFGQPEMMSEYFDQSIIKRTYSNQNDNDNGIIEGNVLPETTVNLENTGITPSTNFTLKNTGSTSLLFAVSPTENTIPTGVGITVPPNTTYYASTSQLGDINDKFLNVYNTSNNQVGSYEVMLL